MPPEILALIDKPHLLVAILFVGALAGIMAEQIASKQQRAAWKKRKIARGEWVERGKRGSWNAPRHDALLGPSRSCRRMLLAQDRLVY